MLSTVRTKEVKISHEKIFFNNRKIELEKNNSNEIYFACLYTQKSPNCIQTWTNILGKTIEWPKVFKSVYNNKFTTK